MENVPSKCNHVQRSNESTIYPADIYLLKINYRNTKTRCEIWSELTINTTGRRQVFFIVNFEHISHIVLVFLLLTLNKYLLAK